MIKKELTKVQELYALHEVRVVDGDTIEAKILLPFKQSVQRRIRLKGWWADELTGVHSHAGILAKMRLEIFLKEKVIWLFSPGHREDKYGRIVACLVWERRIITALEVLGELQLTETVHKAHTDENARWKAAQR